MAASTSLLLADAVLALHGAIAAFVVLGLPFIVVGGLRHWRLAVNRTFRFAHLAAIAFVALQAWLGLACPLTTLEMALRARAGAAAYRGGFIEHWLGRLLYYDAPAWMFVVTYTAFAAAVFATWWWLPPRSGRSTLPGPSPGAGT
ncbi:MAG: DUF2784 domain-containing protein [Burkholderiaceae bacterium]